jgi:multidrug resistance efflux pump
MKLPRLRLGWLLVAAVFVFLGTNLVRAVLADEPTRPRPADVARAARSTTEPGDERLAVPAGNLVGGNGVVEPRDRETRVATSQGGRIARVLVEEGQRVAEGDALIELDAAIEAAALAVAEAELAAAEAELALRVRGSRAEDVLAATAEAEAGYARASLSVGVAERLQTAAQGGGATRDEVERARGQAEADRATAAQLEARRRASVSGSRREELVAARARRDAAAARRDQARAQLEVRTIRAPLAAEVLQVKVRAGEYAQPGGDPLVVLGDTTSLRARIDVDERELGRVRVGATARLRVSAWPGVDFAGRVVALGRRMGRKNVRTDDPVERNDTKILEVLVELAPPPAERPLFVGQRVIAFLDAR